MALQERIADIVACGESVPLAVYTSLEHYSKLDKAADEDNGDIINSGRCYVNWLADCNGPETHKCRGFRVYDCS